MGVAVGGVLLGKGDREVVSKNVVPVAGYSRGFKVMIGWDLY